MGIKGFNLNEYLKFTNTKKSATLSGSIVYFTLFGIVPMAYLCTLILSVIGKELIDVIKPFIYPELTDVALYVAETAKKLGKTGNIIAIFIATYSSANILFHLKSSGEFIYNYTSNNSIFKRATSILLTFFIICVFCLASTIYLILMPLIKVKIGGVIFPIVNVLVMILAIFLLALVINFYVCPYRISLREIMVGCLYTCAVSLFSSAVFFLYIKYFAKYSEIYGAVATILVFLSWLYLMVKSFIDGIILNVFLLGKTAFITKKSYKRASLLKAN